MKTFTEYVKMHEGPAEFDFHGLPKCPDCHVAMNHESEMGRDVETMGGHSIEYLKCNKCHKQWELIDGKLFPHGDRF